MRLSDISHFILLLGLAALSTLSLLPAIARRVLVGDHNAWQRACGSEIARFCERSGPAATKLAQLLSSRGDLLPRSLLAGLSRVQENVRSPSARAIRLALTRSYGPIDAFALISWKPIAAGSIAVVLEGRTCDGDPIAIKLVRPGIARRIRRDLRLIAAMLRLLERLPAAKPFPLVALVEELSGLILGQCDMAAEAENATRLAAIVGGDAIVALPVPGLIRTDAFAMQLIPGCYRMSDNVPLAVYQEACKRLLNALYRMIFQAGFVHCDLHPGNVAIDVDGTPILYDYGLIAELQTKDRLIFRGLLIAIATGNSRRAATELLRAAREVPAALDRSAFDSEVAIIVRRWSGKPTGAFLVAALVRDLFELQHRHSIRSVPGFVAAVWALASFEGLVRERYPDLDFQGEALLFFLGHQDPPRSFTLSDHTAIQEKLV